MTTMLTRGGTRPRLGDWAENSVVVDVLRRGQAIGEQRLDGVGGTFDDEIQLFALGAGELPQHPVRRVLPSGRAADADPHPVEVTGSQRPAQRLQAVVAVVAAAGLHPQGAERKVELVVHDDPVVRRGLEEVPQRTDGTTGLIHVGPWLGQDDAVSSEPCFYDIRARLVRLERSA